MGHEILDSSVQSRAAKRAIVVLGKNMGIGSSPRDIRRNDLHLSQESIFNVLATGAIYRGYKERDEAVDIIFSTGKTAGRKFDSEAAAMAKYFRSEFPDIYEGVTIILEEKSKDTGGNARKIRKLVKRNKYEEVILITVGYHLENAETLFERNGIPIIGGIASEDIVSENLEAKKEEVASWKESEKVKREKKKEQLRKKILIFDRKARVTSAVANLLRR